MVTTSAAQRVREHRARRRDVQLRLRSGRAMHGLYLPLSYPIQADLPDFKQNCL